MGTGVAQLIVYVVAVLGAAAAGVATYRWVGAADGWLGTYLRLAMAGSGLWLVSVVGLVAVKWLVVGEFRPEPVPLWSARYLRFWVAKLAIQVNPMGLLAGTPLYNVFLRSLGMKVGPRSVILTRPPVCIDMVRVGADSVIRHEVVFTGYQAADGWLLPGFVTVGDGALVGDGSVLAPGSSVGDRAQLGPASGLLDGQRVPPGAVWQGSPAEPSTANYDRGERLTITTGRRLWYSASQLAVMALVTLPLALVPVWLATRAGDNGFGVGIGVGVDTGAGVDAGAGIDGAGAGIVAQGVVWLAGLALSALVLELMALASGVLLVAVVPRVLNRFVVPEKAHPLYGFQYQLARGIARLSNNLFMNTVFGDSSMIVRWLSLVGYDLSRSTQTGSNFGVDQQHHSPFLCRFDRNTLVSDGLRMTNLEVSATSFSLQAIAVPPDTYLGNIVRYPADARVGPNCLIATKAAVPVDGPLRTDVGLLGSPAFEIPRSVQRDRLFDLYKQPGVLERRLALKLRSNVVTMLLYLLRWWFLAALGLGLAAGFLALLGATGPGAPLLVSALALTGATLTFTVVSALVSILGERLVTGWRPLEPLYCSLYDPRFWAHERFWKMNYNAFLRPFDGTPFKPWFLRLQGARVGARVFDDGAGLTEPGLVEIGDDCSLNFGSALQAHSLEDGTFKSDRIRLGVGCTVGGYALVHYGTVLGDGCRVDPDAFVMKGSVLEAGSHWQGNPARPLDIDADAEPVPGLRTATCTCPCSCSIPRF